MSVMPKSKKLPSDVLLSLPVIFPDESARARMYVELTAIKYVKRLGEAEWGMTDFLDTVEVGLPTEGELQAKLIHNRLIEIEADKSLTAKRERAFLKFHARQLLPNYTGPKPTCGLPRDLARILDMEYPGYEAIVKLLEFEERKPLSKLEAITVVEQFPNVSQGELADFLGVTDRTIRNWTPDLLAAGWMGTEQERKAAAKSEEPEPPARGEPWQPGDPVPQSSKDD